MLIAPTEITYVISDKYDRLTMEDSECEEEYHFSKQTFSIIEKGPTHAEWNRDERYRKITLPSLRESSVTHFSCQS